MTTKAPGNCLDESAIAESDNISAHYREIAQAECFAKRGCADDHQGFQLYHDVDVLSRGVESVPARNVVAVVVATGPHRRVALDKRQTKGKSRQTR